MKKLGLGLLMALVFGFSGVIQGLPTGLARPGMDRERSRVDLDALPAEVEPVPADLPAGENIDFGAELLAGPAPIGSSFFDVLVVYTPAVRLAEGSAAAVEAKIALAVEETNQAFANSQITPRLRIAATAETAFSEDPASIDMTTMLRLLMQQLDGNMDDVHQLREESGADLVILLVERTDACGIAYLNNPMAPGASEYAFAIVARNCATGSYTFGHEIGHLLGCSHERGSGSPVLSGNSYAFGYVDSPHFRDIMASGSLCGFAPCPRIPHFSNPNVSYEGRPTGVPYPQYNSADTARMINAAASRVSVWSDDQPKLELSVGPARQAGTMFLALESPICERFYEIPVQASVSASQKADLILQAVNNPAPSGPGIQCGPWRAVGKDPIRFEYHNARIGQWGEVREIGVFDNSGGKVWLGSGTGAVSTEIYLTRGLPAGGRDRSGNPSVLRVSADTQSVEVLLAPGDSPESIINRLETAMRSTGSLPSYEAEIVEPNWLRLNAPNGLQFSVEVTDVNLVEGFWTAAGPLKGGAGLIDR